MMLVPHFEQIEAGHIMDGDWISYTGDPDRPYWRAAEVRQGSFFTSLRWQYQGGRCQIKRTATVYRVTWIEARHG